MPGGRLCPACRHTLLSRYNKQPLCGPCTRAAKTAPHGDDGYAAPTWLWDSPPWRDALARADLPAAVAVFRAASGLSQHQLAEITGWSQGTVSFFETGQRETLYDIRELLRFADAVDMPREALLPLVLGRADAAPPHDWYAEITLASADLMEETGVDVDRRTFGGIAAGAAAALTFPEVTVPSRVTASHVRYLQTCVNRLYGQDLAVGGAALLKQAIRQWRRARRMLDESDYTGAIGRELLLVTADLAECAGWLAADGANRQLARSMYGEASLLAGNAGDPVRSVIALARMSGTCAIYGSAQRAHRICTREFSAGQPGGPAGTLPAVSTSSCADCATARERCSGSRGRAGVQVGNRMAPKVPVMFGTWSGSFIVTLTQKQLLAVIPSKQLMRLLVLQP